jgi:hypothetical protein
MIWLISTLDNKQVPSEKVKFLEVIYCKSPLTLSGLFLGTAPRGSTARNHHNILGKEN